VLGNAMTTITKKDLVDRIADKGGNKRVVVKKIIQAFLDEIVAELGNVTAWNFAISASSRFGPARRGWPRIQDHGESLRPQKRTVKFKIGRLMKQRLFGDEENNTRPVRVVNPETRTAASDTA